METDTTATPHEKPEFEIADIEAIRITIDGEEFDKEAVRSLKSKLHEQCLSIVRSTNNEKPNTFSERLNQFKDLFPNPFLFAIAQCIAEATDNEKGITSNEIAEKLGGTVTEKDIQTKMPFIRGILGMLRLKIKSQFSADYYDRPKGADVTSTAFHRLEEIQRKRIHRP